MSPQNFSDAPGLGDAASGAVGGIAIEDLRDLTQPRIGKVTLHGQKPRGCLFAGGSAGSIHFHVSLNERSQKPGPDSPLMIGAVPFPLATGIAPAILRISRRQGAQSERREQVFANFIYHGSGSLG